MVNIIKSTGETEPFSEEKLRASIKRARIPDQIQDLVVNHVKSKLYDNMPTSEIYHHVSEFFEKSPQPFNRTKYRLKSAIMEFGPTGYPFEDYVSELLKKDGHQTDIRQTLNGKCVKHEIDIVAEKNGKKSIIECKFHNRTEGSTQVHVSLYTKARFDDLKDIHKLNDVWLVTNTGITSDALDYALCSGVKVITWKYPEGNGLRDLIEKFVLHPLTVLTTLSQGQKQNLLNNHMVLCRDVINKPESLQILNLPKDKKSEILEEAEYVCKL
ncbi:MAG: ATP-cone protein [uncultured bacterium]|nr:MAG: ATP-cone protein [uncultured bacterium]